MKQAATSLAGIVAVGVAVGIAVVTAAVVMSGCSQSEDFNPDAAPPNDGQSALQAPSRIGFELVANALQPRCGTLDCHGQIGRNLRLFGSRGLRLLAKDSPSEGVTTPEEYDATYWSVIALEPEILTQVVRDGGQRPERLSLIRKGRGIDTHKGAAMIKPGDDLDFCLLGWLAGVLIDSRCRSAAAFKRPGATADAGL